MRRAIAIEEARPVGNVERAPNAPGQGHIESGRQRVALVVIEETKGFFAKFVAHQSTCNAAAPLCKLVRVREMPRGDSANAWRRRRHFPAANPGTPQRQREKDVGIPEGIVIEVIPGGGAKVRDVDGPAFERDGQSELALLVAFYTKRCERAIFGVALIDERTRDGEKRRGLIITPPKGAPDPV